MSEFNERDRFSVIEKAIEVANSDKWGRILSIRHVLSNEDGTFSVMAHINCEFCDYCEQANQDGKLLPGPWYVTGPFDAKEDPYENRNRQED